MTNGNLGLCNQCRGRVPAEFFTRDGQTWIRKTCPECGTTESLVSSDAEAWQAKRDLWNYVPTDPVACTLNCDRCRVDHEPNMVFLDVTNRCNMNCPICIATIRGMGFDFNPPLEYFEKIFAHVSKMKPTPMVELFGGEPTVRDDLLDIIDIGRRFGLKPRVVTNGVRLADEDLCRKLCDAGVRFRFAFDGHSADIYERLRSNGAAYEKKVRALENLDKHSQRRHAIISCAAWGINDQHIGDLIQYCHDHRDLISELGIIPLTENWENGEFDAAVTTTMEDVELMVRQAMPDDDTEFIPAGLSYALRLPRSFFREKSRSEILLLGGVHPNCESTTLLVSDGTRFRNISHYLKVRFSDAAAEFVRLAHTIEPKLRKLDPRRPWQRFKGQALLARTFAPYLLRTVRVGRLMGNPFATLWAIVRSTLRKRSAADPRSRRRPRRLFRLAVLPFEEQHSVDAARMESCKAVFAFEDTGSGEVRTIPACLWYPYRNDLLKALSDKYGVVRKGAGHDVTGNTGEDSASEPARAGKADSV